MTASSEGERPDPARLYLPRRKLLFAGRRGTAVSALSSLAVIGLLISVFFWAPGGATVRATFFSVHDMWIALRGDPSKGLLSVGAGLVTNIWMFLLSEALVLILGLVLAVARVSRSPMLAPFRLLATLYTDVFRGIPILLVVYIIGFGLPALSLGWLSSQSPAVYGVAALTISYSAYVGEVYRAGINSVPHGQILAARSIGLTYPVTLRRVVLPQAVRTVIPPLLNDFISLQKDTALVSTLGAIEATRAAQIYSSTVFNFSSYVVAALLFLVLTVPLTRYTDHLIARDRARRLAGAT